MGRRQSHWRRQEGQRGGRARGIGGGAAGRHARVSPEMLQQLVRRGEPLAAKRRVAGDPVTHVGKLGARGQRGQMRLRVDVDRARRAERRGIRRDVAGLVITLGAAGRTGCRRHARARRQFAVGETRDGRGGGRGGAR